MSDRVLGTVKFFNAEKGFGFIEREDGGEDVFVHITAVRDSGFDKLNDGQKIEFEIGQGKKGPAAKNIYIKR